MERVALVVTVACWTLVVALWVVAAMLGRLRVGAVVALTALVVAAGIGASLQGERPSPETSEGSWLEVLGLIVLVGSTAFAIWARAELGSSWSVNARAPADRRLRTTGPYAVTRHPIYTGILGMLIGSALVSGLVASILVVLGGYVVIEFKIQREERLLLATFPDDYPRYRRTVPQLIPVVRTGRR